MFYKIFPLICMVCCLSSSADARKFTLADGGNPTAVIICPADADKGVMSAINDLADCIERASGASLPILIDGTVVNGTAIHIENTSFVSSIGLPLEKLSYDGYIITSEGSNIVISGRTAQGTKYGIYGFLHDYLGVRWYMPGELWEIIPEADRLLVDVTHKVYRPDFPYRVWQAGWYSPLITEWCSRNRITTYMFEPDDSPYRSFNHNLQNIIKKSVYGESHPEYFAEIDGKRFIPDDDSGRGQPCFTDPGVVDVTVKAIQDYFKINPSASQYSVSINDNNDLCTCENCRSLDEPYVEFRGTKMHSDSYFAFVSKVAEKIAESNPGKTIGCYAYWGVELPPRQIKQLPDNVVIQLTQDSSQHFDKSYKKKDRRIFLDWAKVADRLIQYDYYNLGWLTPRYYPHIIADNLKFIYANKAVGTYAEIYPYWAIQAPQLIMASELAWDIDKDPDAILDEYFNTLYADSATEMRKFYDIMEQIWNKERAGRWFQGLLVFNDEIIMFDMKAMTEAREVLNKALDKSVGVIHDRIMVIRRYFDFCYMIESTYLSALELNDKPIDIIDDLASDIKQINDVLRKIKQTEIIYENTVVSDPAYILSYKPNTPYYQFGCYYKTDQWKKSIVNMLDKRLKALKQWTLNHPFDTKNIEQLDEILNRIDSIGVNDKR